MRRNTRSGLLVWVFLLSGLAGSLARAAVMPRPFGAYIDGPWGQIHMRVAGRSTDSTVILVHMMVWSSDRDRHPELRNVRWATDTAGCVSMR